MPHHCPFCEYTSKRNNNMERHIELQHVHKNKEKITIKHPENICSICNTYFTIRANRIRHEKICKENNKATNDVVIYSIDIQHMDIPDNIIDFHTTKPISYDEFIQEYIQIVFSNNINQNVFITKKRTKECYVLNSNGNWVIMNRLDIINKKTSLFITKLLEHFAVVEIQEKDILNCVKQWRNTFGKLISYHTKCFQKVRIMIDEFIYTYSKERFPLGKFIPFDCVTDIPPLNIEKIILENKMKEEHTLFFGFGGSIS
jgi:hypothetical protein